VADDAHVFAWHDHCAGDRPHYGRDKFLQRLSHPFWFQSFDAVMGQDAE
jgi:hypothetical protein